MEKPTLDELTKQLQHLTAWLPLMVAGKGDWDLHLPDVEDQNIKAPS